MFPRTWLSMMLAMPLSVALAAFLWSAPLAPDEALALLQKAVALRDAAQYDEAEKLFKQVLVEVRRLHGEGKVPEVAEASVLVGLGFLYHLTARYEQVEPLYKRSLTIYEAREGKDSPSVARVLNRLGEFYKDTGRFEQAEVAYKRGLDICEAKFSKDHPDVAIALTNLGRLYRDTEQFDKAEPLLKRSLEIREAKLGKDHLYVTYSLDDLATLYKATRRFELAEPLYKRSLAIDEAKRGKDHPAVATTLNNLAQLYKNMERYEEAEALYRRSLAIDETRLGKDHPHLATTLGNLAALYRDTKRPGEASAAFNRSRRIAHRHVTRVLPSLAERDQIDYLRRIDEPNLHDALELALVRRSDADLVALSAAWVLNGKGLGLQARTQTQLAARDSRDPQLAQDLRDLLDLRIQLARLSLQPAQPGQEDEQRKRLADLAAREQRLTERVQRLGSAVQTPAWVELKEVQASLGSDAILIEFVRVVTVDFVKERRRSTARYGAWITPKTGAPRLVYLGEAQPIDDAVRQLRKGLEEAPRMLKAEGEIKAERAIRGPLAKLARLVLDPLRQHIDRAERWVISPDGNLWQVPWAALPLDEKTYAIEKHTIQLVVSGRDLLPRAGFPGRTTAPAIFANPDFNSAATGSPAELRGLSAELKLGGIPPLPGTGIEAEAIADKVEKLFGRPVLLTEGKATSAALLALNRPRALTLATHGFFLPDQELDSGARSARIEDPLLRCGLLLAGCNKPGEAGRAGVLTGREVLSADLRGCELVTLSACETGLGEVRNGEGVAGLRQAFQLAGAESVLASLWQVPDDETTLQMVAFMDALAKGKDRVEALAQAQRQRISQRREKFGAAHPFNWAAFTLTGGAGR
jgi:CHAT domain-containing protein/Tfp pilus assembly protein PilF